MIIEKNQFYKYDTLKFQQEIFTESGINLLGKPEIGHIYNREIISAIFKDDYEISFGTLFYYQKYGLIKEIIKLVINKYDYLEAQVCSDISGKILKDNGFEIKFLEEKNIYKATYRRKE